MYLIEHNCKIAMNPMLIQSFEEAVACMKLYLAMGYEVKLRKLKINTFINKEKQNEKSDYRN